MPNELTAGRALAGSLRINGGSERNEVVVKVPLGALDAAGGILAWKNPEPGAIIVTRLIVDATTKATGACTADFGVAANGTTSNDSLIDGLDVGTAAVLADNLGNGGTNGKARQKVAAGSYVTGSVASGASAGLVGSALIAYVVL